MSETLKAKIFAALDGTIEADDFQQLQQELQNSSDARAVYLRCVELFESLSEVGADQARSDHLKLGATVVQQATPDEPAGRWHGNSATGWLAIAAAILLLCSLAAFSIGRQSTITKSTLQDPELASTATTAETMVAGHASLRRTLDVQWRDGSPEYRSGDLIPAGKLVIDDGVLELDFFCGASLVVEGPAELDIRSDWELTCYSGRLRANVPPAARGFVVNAADAKIVDLGTEFALQVTPDDARVEVIDGEVEIQQAATQPDRLITDRLVTGQQKWLTATRSTPRDVDQIPSQMDLQKRRADQLRDAHQRWLTASQTLRNDDRLIAYFPIGSHRVDGDRSARRIVNAAATGDSRDGFLVGSVMRSEGRFGELSTGLEFDRPGARMRMRLDGTFDAFTFVTWVRIDSLQHRYNALLMADGYENGEPHWQINNDGEMMFSVMVDDRAEITYYSQLEDAVVQDAGRHFIYRTPPIWELSKSGRWMQLAAVYDPQSKRVRQYVDGEKISDQRIDDDLLVKQLHIGPSEIGNWGQPFRKTPAFAVRNLDGTIDEMAIFNAALSDREIRDLFLAGQP